MVFSHQLIQWKKQKFHCSQACCSMPKGPPCIFYSLLCLLDTRQRYRFFCANPIWGKKNRTGPSEPGGGQGGSPYFAWYINPIKIRRGVLCPPYYMNSPLQIFRPSEVLQSYQTLFFSPGMHFSQAVASIQSMVGSVKGVQILYSDKVMHLWFLLN